MRYDAMRSNAIQIASAADARGAQRSFFGRFGPETAPSLRCFTSRCSGLRLASDYINFLVCIARASGPISGISG